VAGKTSGKKATVAPVQPAQVYARIHELLYTLRAIAQREDQLCILMHHLRTSGKLSTSLTAELHEILDEIPTQEYVHDLQALRESLAVAEGAAGTAGVAARRGQSKRRAA
jgi:hypothetical protein